MLHHYPSIISGEGMLAGLFVELVSGSSKLQSKCAGPKVYEHLRLDPLGLDPFLKINKKTANKFGVFP